MCLFQTTFLYSTQSQGIIMYTLSYKSGFINGYTNGGLFMPMIENQNGSFIRGLCKTLTGAKRWITLNQKGDK